MLQKFHTLLYLSLLPTPFTSTHFVVRVSISPLKHSHLCLTTHRSKLLCCFCLISSARKTFVNYHPTKTSSFSTLLAWATIVRELFIIHHRYFLFFKSVKFGISNIYFFFLYNIFYLYHFDLFTKSAKVRMC